MQPALPDVPWAVVCAGNPGPSRSGGHDSGAVQLPLGRRELSSSVLRVLVIDDHAQTRELIRRRLEGDGHVVQQAGSCGEARALLAKKRAPDVIVLDVMLPDGSGVDLCREVRDRGTASPILLLTARGDVRDRVTGLDAGADDYLAKPFAVAELLSRVRALGRRGPALREARLSAGDITIDLERRRVWKGDRPVPLTARELAIVEVLALRKGALMRRDDLIEAVWGEATESSRASFEVLIARVRRKLGGAEAPVRNVRNVGYLLEVDP
jgi:DNA-binding response OmpR family regulator